MGANRENCWNTRATCLHHNVARKGERDGPKSKQQEGQSAAEGLKANDSPTVKVQRSCTWRLTQAKI